MPIFLKIIENLLNNNKNTRNSYLVWFILLFFLIFIPLHLASVNAKEEESPTSTIDGKEVSFPFTDENIGESLIMRTDKETYGGWDRTTALIHLENIRRDDETFDLEFLFSKEGEYIEKLEYFSKDSVWEELNLKEGSILEVPEGMSRKYIPEEFKATNRTKVNVQGKSSVVLKAYLRFPPHSGVQKFYLEAFGSEGGYGLLDPWYNNNYKYRRKVTIDNTKVATTTGNVKFAILATSTVASMKSVGNGGNVENVNGNDIFLVD